MTSYNSVSHRGVNLLIDTSSGTAYKASYLRSVLRTLWQSGDCHPYPSCQLQTTMKKRIYEIKEIIMKRIILLMLILLTLSMLSATRATGYSISAPVTINTLMPPIELFVVELGATNTLSWSPPIAGYPSSYNIYRSDTPDNLESFAIIGVSYDATFEDYDFFSGGYYVTAVHSLGESRPSGIAYVGRMQPVAVTLSIDSVRNSAVLSWQRLREAESYQVYYTDNPNANFPTQWSGPYTITDNSFVDPLANKRFYKVMARVSDGTRNVVPIMQKSKRK